MSMTDEDGRHEAALAPFFEAARRQAPAPSADLLLRVLDDAGAAQAQIAAGHAARGPRADAWAGAWVGLRRWFAQGIGGWPVMAGLATAGVAGVWIGLALPDMAGSGAEADYLVDIAPGLALEAGGEF